MHLSQRTLQELVARFLEEDIGFGDITTLAVVPETALGHGRLIAKAPLVIAGLEVAQAAFQVVDARVQWQSTIQDGAALKPRCVFVELHGPGRALLTAERVALNLLQRLSGVATLTRRYVEAVQHTPARVIDTRKTTPGLRALEKYAVRVGGGHNHRFGLSDGVLIKDNHIAIVGSIEQAVAAVRANVSHLQTTHAQYAEQGSTYGQPKTFPNPVSHVCTSCSKLHCKRVVLYRKPDVNFTRSTLQSLKATIHEFEDTFQ